MSRKNRPVSKDMYWFAHGGVETPSDKCITQRGDDEENETSCFMGKNSSDRRVNYEDIKAPYLKDTSLTDGSSSSGPASLERDDRLHLVDKRMAVEERKKLLWEAEQERNDAVMKKHMEREAALEAKRNAQRSNISFAFGSSVPRNVDALQNHQGSELDCMSRSFTAGGLSYKGDDLMTRSMTASISAPRGRRKNDLMPTVPYDRTATPRVATSSSSRRRSVSMTRLDQLAQPRKHYVEATKAHSTASSGASSMLKDGCSPNRPLSSASEHSGGRLSASVTRRVRATPRKPRPVSIAGTIPDQKPEIRVTPIKRTYTPLKKTENLDVKRTPSSATRTSPPKSSEKVKSTPRLSPALTKVTTPKPTTVKMTPKPKKLDPKQVVSKVASSITNSTPKTQVSKNSMTNKKKNDLQVSSAASPVKEKSDQEEKSCSPPPESDNGNESDKNGKRIISEEEAKAALAEKRRLAREQAEREAELERQKQEELRRLEDERLKQEEEEQRQMEEEHMRLIEEHRRQEEEKLRKAIEDQEQKEEEERVKRDEEMRMKAEQEKKAKEEAEKLRIELEEKLRKEEEERAERKKRLEKIMSRTRGKSSGTSPSGSISGSDQLDSGENQQEGFSSGANSLESNDGKDQRVDSSSDDGLTKMEVSSPGNSTEANITYDFGSNDVSLNSNDLMLPTSEASSQDNSIALDKEINHEELVRNTESSGAITPINQDLNVDLPEDNVVSSTANTNDQEVTVSEKKAIEIQQQNTNEDIKENNESSDPLAEADVSERISAVDSAMFQQSHCQQLDIEFNDTILTETNEFNLPDLTNSGIVQEENSIENLPADENKDLFTEQNFSEYQMNNLSQDTFSTDNIAFNEELMSQSIYQDLNADKVDGNPFSVPNPFSEAMSTPQDDTYVIQKSEDENILNESRDFVAQPHLVEDDNINISKDYGINDEDFSNSKIPINDIQSFGENANKHSFESSPVFDMSASMILNQNSDNVDDLAGGDSQISSNNATSGVGLEVTESTYETFQIEKDNVATGSAGDNPFVTAGENKLNLQSQFEDHLVLESEQINIENQTLNVNFDSNEQNLDNVTLIKEEGSENYVGIISSIDNDQLSNNYSQLHEQSTNFECASATESEESSLDSNLSQVATDNDKNIFTTLSKIESSIVTDSIHLNSNNIGHSDNPFTTEGDLNQSSIPQSNHYSVSEVYTNGHSVHSSQAISDSEFVQLDGNGILCVDHPKNNIFDNVDTINYSEVSPDPFLVKGSSKQISGNPFLRQDDQNQVLVTSDFLN